MNRTEFQGFLSHAGLFLSSQELSDLFRHYNTSKTGEITKPEFRSGLQASLSPQRSTAVNRVWLFLDPEIRNTIPLSQLIQAYNATQHPRVLSREKAAEELKLEFISDISKYETNGVISKARFIEYYEGMNATVPLEHESYFLKLLANSYNITNLKSLVPPPRIQQIEELIYEKIRQRCRGDEDEGRAMLKTFRHFDRDRSGSISYEEFIRCLENWGCTYTELEIRALFNKFDVDGSGFLDYEEFSGQFAKKGAGGRHQFLGKVEFPSVALNKIKAELLRRGASGIRGLGIVFRRMDRSRDNFLDKGEFEWALRENGHILSPVDTEQLFKYFDKNHDGKISYDEFLVKLRGDLNERRKRLVGLAYQKLDKNHDGQVTVDDLRLAYDVSFHPDFKSGTKTSDQILREFMGQWDTIKSDGIVSLEEFEEYYKDISASVDLDDEFELMIRNAWHIEGGEGWCENTTIPRYLETDANGTQRVVMAKEHQTLAYSKSQKRFWNSDI